MLFQVNAVIVFSFVFYVLTSLHLTEDNSAILFGCAAALQQGCFIGLKWQQLSNN